MATGGKDKRIDYVEFNVSDIARSRRFYGEAFGWTFTDYGPTYSAFAEGLDLHAMTASTQSGIPYDELLERIANDDVEAKLRRTKVKN